MGDKGEREGRKQEGIGEEGRGRMGEGRREGGREKKKGREDNCSRSFGLR